MKSTLLGFLLMQVTERIMRGDSGEILMAKDKSLISVYVPQEVKEKLEEWAGEEDRSVSYIVGRLITDALETREQHTAPQPEKPTKGKRRDKAGG